MVELNSTVGDKNRKRLPPWFKVRIRTGPHFHEVKALIKGLHLHTVCEEARCPNIWECWNNRTATIMILGNICTRRCGFCAVETGRPKEVDFDEPERVAQTVKALGLRHAVITSVDRDDLTDGGAGIFADTIRKIKKAVPDCTAEVLIPDFKGSEDTLKIVLEAGPDILGHNIETVPRLYPMVRPQARYERSIGLLQRAKESGAITKTGLMLGLGERVDEVFEVMKDLKAIHCDILTLGQYLRPTGSDLFVLRYYNPEEFLHLKKEGEALGFRHVEAGPLVRSSYHAHRQYTSL